MEGKNNLVLDFGNTRTKVGIFENQKLIFSQSFEKFTLTNLKKILKEYDNIGFSLVSAVVKENKNIINYLSAKTNLIALNENTPIPIINKYATPHTLGKDRLAVACAAAALYKKQDTLVINCGTCITYDVINSKGVYLGGSISPGLQMRFKALQHFTQKLPLVVPVNSTDEIGNTTTSCINTGVVNGITAEIVAKKIALETKYKSLNTVITGGDADFIKKQIKNKIFAVSHLTLIGLNEIINFNK